MKHRTTMSELELSSEEEFLLCLAPGEGQAQAVLRGPLPQEGGAGGGRGWSEGDGGRENPVPFPSGFPEEKRIPGTRFVVDGFRHAGPHTRAYFLSHFHSDHYQGLTPSWRHGLIFCSPITARLLHSVLGVPSELVRALPMQQRVRIDGVEVSLVDAHHCPGAVLLLFSIPPPETEAEVSSRKRRGREGREGRKGCSRKYVHTGDMRFHSSMLSCPLLQDFVGADAVFLDTTYCNPRYVFPPQEATVAYVAEQVHRALTGQEGDGGSSAEAAFESVPGNSLAGTSADEEIATGVEESSGGAEADGELVSEGPAGLPAPTGMARELTEGNGDGLRQGGLAQAALGSVLENGECRMGAGKIEELPGPHSEEPRGQGGATSSEAGDKGSENGAAGTRRAFCGGPVVFIATYLIGKEKILLAVAKRCRSKIYVEERKWKILAQLDLGPDALRWFTTDPAATRIHVVGWGFLGDTWPYFRPNFANMEQALSTLGADRAVGVVPTGWTYELKKKTFSVRKKVSGACRTRLGNCLAAAQPPSEYLCYVHVQRAARL